MNIDNKGNTGQFGESSVYYRNNRLYKVSDEFINLTGYAYHDIAGKSLQELYRLLKANIDDSFKDIKDDDISYKGYIFTNKDQPKHVEITCEDLNKENKKKYILKESSSGFLNGLLATCVDNHKKDTDAIAIYSYPNLIHLKANRNYMDKYKLFRLDTTELIGSIYKPENPNITDDIEDKGYFYSKEKELIDKNGKVSYWTIKSNLIYEEGEAKYLKNIFTDQTENVLIRKKLEKQTAEMEMILDNVPDSIVKLNSNGEYTYKNKSALENMSPYITNCKYMSDEEFFEIFKYHDINGNELPFDEIPSSRVLRGENLKNDIIIGTSDLPTTYHECTGTPIYDENGNIESAVIIYKDIKNAFKISESTAIENNMKHMEINYATMSLDGFKIKYINDNALEAIKKSYFNISSVLEVTGKNFFDFYTRDPKEKDEVIANIINIIKGKSCRYVHKQKIIGEGKTHYIKTIFQPILNKNNEIEDLSCLGMYITDEELTNQKMAESLQTQEEIFINTSHELKTPINLIFTASQLLDIYLNLETLEDKKEKIKHNNQIIMQNCYRTIKLINNITDVSRMEKGFYELSLANKDIVSIVEKIVTSVSDYIKGKDLTIIFDPKVEEKIIALDLYKFERIMLNLISNAIKFSEYNGIIFIDLIDKDNFVEVSVKDQGIGIDKGNLEFIFNKFKQENKSLNRKTEGTGIGLSLVKSIVELHGGTIDVESTVNVGSKFTVNLPSKVIDEPVSIRDEYIFEDRIEMIRFELSDIYS